MEKTEKRVLTLDRYEHGVVINAWTIVNNLDTKRRKEKRLK